MPASTSARSSSTSRTAPRVATSTASSTVGGSFATCSSRRSSRRQPATEDYGFRWSAPSWRSSCRPSHPLLQWGSRTTSGAGPSGASARICAAARRPGRSSSWSIPLWALWRTRSVGSAVLVGLAANVVNQLDTRPGRALKAFLVGSALLGGRPRKGARAGRPPRSLRSSRDEHAGRRRVERFRGHARFGVREAVDRPAESERDRRARRRHPRRRTAIARIG